MSIKVSGIYSQMCLLKLTSENVYCFLVLRCLPIALQFVQAVLYQKLPCFDFFQYAAENKRQTISSDLNSPGCVSYSFLLFLLY